MSSLLVLCSGLVRGFSTSNRNWIKNRVLEKQKLFQEDNGLPVHLKGGATDALLYRITMAISLAGTCLSVFQLVRASFPRKGK
ncbi:cytochrome c oxidase subunit 7A1, mitochondrial [Microcaecilia unicolor]|uniref:Cytochrome c oxidase subunit 7A1, mitochondrial n=1 Tax=Microcaecilia unicolor TaxID=1415580 RepID=A0A6P7ZNH4_9AMPH|nr:cytochrome c oxidase subunit 7A1, mitochondrial [Microcaecilia unicolor]